MLYTEFNMGVEGLDQEGSRHDVCGIEGSEFDKETVRREVGQEERGRNPWRKDAAVQSHVRVQQGTVHESDRGSKNN